VETAAEYASSGTSWCIFNLFDSSGFTFCPKVTDGRASIKQKNITASQVIFFIEKYVLYLTKVDLKFECYSEFEI
jgi:hypothetical protein